MVVSSPSSSSSRRAVSLDFSEMFFGGGSSSRSSRSNEAERQPTPGHPIKRPPPLSSQRSTSRMTDTLGTIRRNLSLTERSTPVPHVSKPELQALGLSDRRLSTFPEWLEHMLDGQGVVANVAHKQHKQPRSGFQAILDQQNKEQLRKKSSKLWQSDEMKIIRSKLEAEITKGRIKIREDRDMVADLTLRKQILSILMSYQVHWLWLGFETVFGETIVITNSIPARVLSDGAELKPRTLNPTAKTRAPDPQIKKIQAALQNFTVNHVLSDPKVLSKYTRGLCRVPSGRFETKYRAEMRELILYRLLVLFFFLDRAKHSGLGDEDNNNTPNLFAEESSIKSTRAVLLNFCKHFLSKEGDFVKSLSRMGLNVFCRQESFDEVNFGLKFHMEVADPCDGVLLARLAAIVTRVPFRSILLQMKLPATKRALRDYNIRHVCKLLRKHDASLVDATSVHLMVEGDRGSYLKLIRTVVARYNLNMLVDEDELRIEIGRLQHSSDGIPQEQKSKGNKADEDRLKEGRVRLLLLEWCDTVCSKFGVNVTNLTTDFADGIVVCLMIHHYLPSVLPLSEIKRTSRKTDFLIPLQSDVGDEIVREHERLNCKLANDRVSTLGQMGRLVPVSDNSHLPDPKAVLLALAYIFARAPLCRKQTEASKKLQRFFLRKQRNWLERRKERAANVILRHWRSNKEQYFENQRQKYGRAVRTIERFFLEMYFRKQLPGGFPSRQTTAPPQIPSAQEPGSHRSSEGTETQLSSSGGLLRLWQDRIEEELPDLDSSSCSSSSGTWSILSAFSFSRSQTEQGGKQPRDLSGAFSGEQQPIVSSQWTSIKQEVAKWQDLVSDRQNANAQKNDSGRDEAFQDLFSKWSSFKTDKSSYLQQIFGSRTSSPARETSS